MTNVALLMLVATAAATPPPPQPCTDAAGAGTLPVGPTGADFAQIPEACPATDVGLRLGTGVLIDRPDYYGMIGGAAAVRGRYRLSPGFTAMGALDLLAYRYAVNANVDAGDASFGPATAGISYRAFVDDGAVTPYLRFLLPFETARRHSRRYGAELGVSFDRRPHQTLGVRGGVTVPATLVTIDDVGIGAVSPAGLLELVWGPRPWMALAAGAAVRGRLLPTNHLDALAPRASATFVTRRRLRFVAATEIPLAGRERTDFAVALYAAHALD